MSKICVMWLGGSISNVDQINVIPATSTQTKLFLWQDVIVRCGSNNDQRFCGKIYSLSEVAIGLTNDSQTPDNDGHTSMVENECLIIGDHDTESEPEPKRFCGTGGGAEPQMSTQPCDHLQAKMTDVLASHKLILDKMESLHRRVGVYMRETNDVCAQNAAQTEILRENINLQTTLTAKVDHKVKKIYQIVAENLGNDDPQSPMSSQKDANPLFSPSGTQAAAHLPVAPIVNIVLTPVETDESGDAVLKSSQGTELVVPIDVFNKAMESGSPTKFLLVCIRHCYSKEFLTHKSYETLKPDPTFQVLWEEAIRRFPNANLNKMTKVVTNACINRKYTTPKATCRCQHTEENQ